MEVDYTTKRSTEDILKKKSRFSGFLPGKMSSSKGTSKAVWRVWEMAISLRVRALGTCRVQRNPQRLQPLHLHRGQPRRQCLQLNHGASSLTRLPHINPSKGRGEAAAERAALHAHAHGRIRGASARGEARANARAKVTWLAISLNTRAARRCVFGWGTYECSLAHARTHAKVAHSC